MKHIAAFLSIVLFAAAGVEAKPLKVFILAGQSNMEGPAHIRTIKGIGDDPVTTPMLKDMLGPEGKPVVCPNVWLSYLTGEGDNNTIETTGRMTAGYGSLWGLDHSKPGDKIGPEFTFGIYMSKAVKEPILIIKTAWGGKSLHTDFRSPSAGAYELNDYQKKLYCGPKGHGVPEDMDKWLADKKKDPGHYYRLMTEHIRKVFHRNTCGSDGLLESPFSPQNPVNNFPRNTCRPIEPGWPGKPCPTPVSGTSSLRSSPPETGVGRERRVKIAPAGKNFLPNRCRNCHHSSR